MNTKKNYMTIIFISLLSIFCMISLWTVPIKAEDEPLDFTWEPKQPIIGETITVYGPETYKGGKVIQWSCFRPDGARMLSDKRSFEIQLNSIINKFSFGIETSDGIVRSVDKEIIAEKGATGVIISDSYSYKNYKGKFDNIYSITYKFQGSKSDDSEKVYFKIDDWVIGSNEFNVDERKFEFSNISNSLNSLEVGEYSFTMSYAGNEELWGFSHEIAKIYVYGVTGIDIVSPASMIKGDSVLLQAGVNVQESEQFPVKKDIEWKLENQTSKDTKLVDGMLSVGSDETATSLKVTATSVSDTSFTKEIEIQLIDQTHDVLPGSSTNIKNGENGYWEFDGNYSELTGILLDGTAFTINPINSTSANLYMNGYTDIAGTVKEGSVKVTLDQDYLKTLSTGKHTLEVQFQSGTGQAAFEIEHEIPPVIEPIQPEEPNDERHDVITGTMLIENGKDGFWEFTGNYQELSKITLDGTAFTIEPINSTSANLYMNGYSGVAGMIEEGSVKITLYQDFLKTLTNGSHVLEIVFESDGKLSYGETSFELEIKEQPNIKPVEPVEPETDEPKQESEETKPIENKPIETKPKEINVIQKETPIKETSSHDYVVYGYIMILCLLGSGWIFFRKHC